MQNSLTVRAQKIASLETKLAELKEAERIAGQRRKSAKSRAERVVDTRRKVLLGAFVLDQIGGVESAAKFALGSRTFAGWLTRDSDRSAFCLASLAPPARESASQQTLDAGGGQ
jgi:hypothetical protein